jgi:UDP:flavonoid glycosyltransferase YjiC (YdhE family)
VAEAVTMAQVVRLVALARALDPARYDLQFASARFDELVFAGTRFTRIPIHSLAPDVVARAVARGARIYDAKTLAAYADEDLRVLNAVRPALVVGDLRWSLAVAAPLARVPHAALINAYWSPFAVRDRFPLPDHPIVRLLGERMAAKYFPRALPGVFEWFARPLNDLRRRHGLSPVGDLPALLTHGDHTLFPDVPELVPTKAAPGHHRYLGPVPWSPPVPLPTWWNALDPGRPTAYATLGSSGRADLVPIVVAGLAAAGVQVLLSTAGQPVPASLPERVWAAPYLPGELAARRADFVVSNGGSTTGYQALTEGRPLIGVAFNLDQYLATDAIARAGAGLLLRAGSLDRARVEAAARRILVEPGFARAARALASTFARWDGPARFRDFVAETVG